SCPKPPDTVSPTSPRRRSGSVVAGGLRLAPVAAGPLASANDRATGTAARAPVRRPRSDRPGRAFANRRPQRERPRRASAPDTVPSPQTHQGHATPARGSAAAVTLHRHDAGSPLVPEPVAWLDRATTSAVD